MTSLDDWKPRIAHTRGLFTSDRLAQFHAEFWGVKGVTDTEGEQEDSDEGDMEIDDSTAEDIDPRCYVLDIDIRGVEDKIWIRADYIRMFKFAEEFYIENVSNMSPCFVITGQPGTGELF